MPVCRTACGPCLLPSTCTRSPLPVCTKTALQSMSGVGGRRCACGPAQGTGRGPGATGPRLLTSRPFHPPCPSRGLLLCLREDEGAHSQVSHQLMRLNVSRRIPPPLPHPPSTTDCSLEARWRAAAARGCRARNKHMALAQPQLSQRLVIMKILVGRKKILCGESRCRLPEFRTSAHPDVSATSSLHKAHGCISQICLLICCVCRIRGHCCPCKHKIGRHVGVHLPAEAAHQAPPPQR